MHQSAGAALSPTCTSNLSGIRPPPLPTSLRVEDNDSYHDPSPYILYTTHLHAPPIPVPYLALDFASLGIGSIIAGGFVALPT